MISIYHNHTFPQTNFTTKKQKVLSEKTLQEIYNTISREFTNFDNFQRTLLKKQRDYESDFQHFATNSSSNRQHLTSDRLKAAKGLLKDDLSNLRELVATSEKISHTILLLESSFSRVLAKPSDQENITVSLQILQKLQDFIKNFLKDLTILQQKAGHRLDLLTNQVSITKQMPQTFPYRELSRIEQLRLKDLTLTLEKNIHIITGSFKVSKSLKDHFNKL